MSCCLSGRLTCVHKTLPTGVGGYLAYWHDDVSKWKHFPHYRLFVRGIHRSPANSPRKVQRYRALMFSFICAGINGWVNSREAGDLRRHYSLYDVTVMATAFSEIRLICLCILKYVCMYYIYIYMFMCLFMPVCPWIIKVWKELSQVRE